MSPGPATYRSKAGFDAVKWKANDVRSPEFSHRKRKSVQLAKGPPYNPTSNFVIVASATAAQKASQGTIMRELYGRLVDTIQVEIKGLKKENGAKEEVLNERENVHKGQLAECRNDLAIKGSNINDTVLAGDIAVKVIRVPTGKTVGPGSYSPNGSLQKNSHNLRGVRQFQDLKSTTRQKRDTSQIITTFYETGRSDLTKILSNSKDTFNLSNLSAKKVRTPLRTPERATKCRVPLTVKSKPPSPMINMSEICDQTVTTDNESKGGLEEGVMTPHPYKSKEPILIEYARLIPKERESMRKNVVTPEFRGKPHY